MIYQGHIRGPKAAGELNRLKEMMNKFLPGEKEFLQQIVCMRSRNGWYKFEVRTANVNPWAEVYERDGLIRRFRIYETSKYKLPRWLKEVKE